MSHAQRKSMPDTRNSCFIRAYAKINLTLDVLGRRADSYHELATVMQEIDLYDTLCLTATGDGRVQVHCSVPELNNAENLVVRAAELMRQQAGLEQGAYIELLKRIPMAAGLGGGSSDAAAVLLALRRQLPTGDPEGRPYGIAAGGLKEPIRQADLLTLATALGSDVPFFLTGGLALCEGRGERVQPLAAHLPPSMRWLLLLKPAISISTSAVFRNLSASDYSDGSHSRAVCAALMEGRSPQPQDLHNALERGVLEAYPEVAQAREAMLQAGAPLVRLSGSGPTLFAPFAELAQAVTVQRRLQGQGYEVYLSRAVSPDPGDVDFF